MNTFKHGIFAGIAAIALTSCVKDTLYDARGNIEVTTRWDNISTDAAVPDEYTMRLRCITTDEHFTGSDLTAVVTGNRHPFPDNVIGDYRLAVYNTPEGVTLSGNRAAVDKVNGTGLMARPGTMFSSDYTEPIHVSPAATTAVTINMVQLMRSLNLALNVVEGDYERIVTATASIDGVYGAVDYITHTADPADRTRTTDEPLVQADNKLSTSYRLFALPSADYDGMTLTVNILFSNGETSVITADISDMTKNFGNDVSPLTVTADLHLPVKGAAGGSIDGWIEADGGNIDAK